MSAYERLRERYASGETPWDHELPPPELMATIEALPPGRALDLGCGYGRAAIYMARHQWQVDAVDFIDLAIEEAVRRAEQAGVAARIQFHVSPVTDLHYLTGPYDFALDVGCMHNFDEAALRAYRDELVRLLRPGGLYCSLPICGVNRLNMTATAVPAGCLKSSSTLCLPLSSFWNEWFTGRQPCPTSHPGRPPGSGSAGAGNGRLHATVHPPLLSPCHPFTVPPLHPLSVFGSAARRIVLDATISGSANAACITACGGRAWASSPSRRSFMPAMWACTPAAPWTGCTPPSHQATCAVCPLSRLARRRTVLSCTPSRSTASATGSRWAL
jgi:SAM-dependent methyltransferase